MDRNCRIKLPVDSCSNAKTVDIIMQRLICLNLQILDVSRLTETVVVGSTPANQSMTSSRKG